MEYVSTGFGLKTQSVFLIDCGHTYKITETQLIALPMPYLPLALVIKVQIAEKVSLSYPLSVHKTSQYAEYLSGIYRWAKVDWN